MAKVPSSKRYVLSDPNGIRQENEDFTLEEIQQKLNACQIDSTWKIDESGSHAFKPLKTIKELVIDYDVAIVVHYEDLENVAGKKLVKQMTKKLKSRGLSHRIVRRAPVEKINSDLPPPGDDFIPDAPATYLSDAGTVICLSSNKVSDCEELLAPLREFCCAKGQKKPLITRTLDRIRLPPDIEKFSDPDKFAGPNGATYDDVRIALEIISPSLWRQAIKYAPMLAVPLSIAICVIIFSKEIEKFSTPSDKPKDSHVDKPKDSHVDKPKDSHVVTRPIVQNEESRKVAVLFREPVIADGQTGLAQNRRDNQVRHSNAVEAVAKRIDEKVPDIGIIYLGFKNASAMTFESGSRKNGELGSQDVGFFYWNDFDFEVDFNTLERAHKTQLKSKASEYFSAKYWPVFKKATHGEIPNFQTLKRIYIVGDLPRLIFGQNQTGPCELQEKGFFIPGSKNLQKYPGDEGSPVSMAVGFLTSLRSSLQEFSGKTKVEYDPAIEEVYFNQLQSLKQ